MYFLSVALRHPVTNEVRQRSFTFEPAELDNAKMAALRSRILGWVAELDTAAGSDPHNEPL